jgi:hypothetical protein
MEPETIELLGDAGADAAVAATHVSELQRQELPSHEYIYAADEYPDSVTAEDVLDTRVEQPEPLSVDEIRERRTLHYEEWFPNLRLRS